MSLSSNSAAAVIARSLKARGVDRVFALCGGHIMPLWMAIDAEGIAIVDVRDERAAVYMAHAYGELRGTTGVALVTAGPGVTNAMTGIANAHVARASVVVLSGTPPRAQDNRGALQDLDHVGMVRGITRYARTVRDASLVPQELDEAFARACGDGGEPGPVYLDFPTDVLRADVPVPLQRAEHLAGKARVALPPAPQAVQAAIDVLWTAKRPLVIAGRGIKGRGAALRRFLDALGAVYLDTGECKGLLPASHPSFVGAMRGQVMGAADVVVTVGRRLDFQLAYGSPAVFGDARFVRIADVTAELRDNRRGDVEVLADCGLALAAIVAAAQGREPAVDREWVSSLRQQHEARAGKLRASMRTAESAPDGKIHPNRVLACLQDALDARGGDPVVVADGGDFLSFARVGLDTPTYLDPGPLGCIGIGTPFGIGAALACPERTVVVATGDGSFGFNAMEIDTAVRHRAPLLIVVANNGAWQIEVNDQQQSWGRVVGTTLQFADHAAMARAFGMHAERVTDVAELPAAIERALAQRPALLDVVVRTDVVSADGKSGLAVVPDLQPLGAWDEAERRFRAGA
ncbi:MAG: thiamine pyrophosphate-binding protein [Burkholderiales bacterium]|nr:thiamine pyrophosphate-binding protein [Burkholderiales bacterium]